jgi:hypothetical protein
MAQPVTPDLVRQWVIVLLGTALVIYGLFDSSLEAVMLGFTTLGSEPMFRAREEIHK